MTSPGFRRRFVMAAATAALGLVAVFITPSAAFADDGIILTPPAQSGEYGQGWAIQGTITPAYTSTAGPGTIYGDFTVTVDGKATNLGAIGTYQGQFTLSDYVFQPSPSLGAGTHKLSVTTSGAYVSPLSSGTAVLTITPAKIVTTTTIVPDPNNSNNAIVNSQLSGAFVDQLPSCECEGENGFDLPAGTWDLTITDSKGKTVYSKHTDQPAKGLPSSVNYWQNVPAGETFSAQSTFTVAGSAAVNFAFTSPKFSWTSDKKLAAGGGSQPAGRPSPTPLKPAAFAPPVIAFIAVLVLALLLVALDVVLLIRRRRPGVASQIPAGEETA